ncbi:glycoside hydrolase family 31 protein [Oceanobacillus bengalensis]|uniref:Glycoside hydrolase family 31 protein n=1 Tax=Oceanobacillus bengalensis TaxID=1435466 RepID=A0A494Z6H4_9BACI|nr:glycoside hydrolase family 31 protein [Oceanobacillus bengalensis]RKQ18170.1 glycoside hydrolase family 31 protein [Oceanobacillus bengalensis]
MLEDTSFAIHPGKGTNSEAVIYRSVGNLKSYSIKDNVYQFHCENGEVAIQFYTESIVRIVMNQHVMPNLKDSQTVISTPIDVVVTEELMGELFELKTNQLSLHIEKAPFRLTVKDRQGRTIVSEGKRGITYQENGRVTVFKEMDEADHFYGFGEKTGHLDKRGEKYEMWNSDVFAPHNPETDPLYESIPYFMTLRNGKAHGIFFDNTFRTVFDMKSDEDYYSFSAEGGQVDYYLMAGPSPKEVLEQYTHLTGRIPLPPKWAIGYHQSRYSYETEAEVRELAKNFIERDIPIDVIHLDIHYMNGYRVFTFDKESFPNPEKLIADLRDMGIRIVPIVDPGVKKDPEYPIYQEGIREDQFCKYIEGNIYFGEVWPGDSAFPDFTDEKVRKWWGDKHAYYTDLGVEGIWNDMNEPAVFNETKTMDLEVMHYNDGEPRTHRELHNVYGLLMGKATYEGLREQLNGKRPFLLTRAGYAGVQRYASVWTGDNRSFWEHLQMSIPMVMNLGLSGVAFTGPDVGGFAHDTNAELLTRWMQVGAFTPFFRNHSAIGTVYQEPWQFGGKYEKIMKKYIQMRYEWMPQLYSLFYQASKSGLPVMRPLLMEYPKDEKTYNLNDQFMIGDNVVIAPILAPSVTDRAVYLPEGEWVEFSTGEVYEGSKTHLVHAELKDLPIFIRKGTAIMQGSWSSNKDKETKNVTMNVYPGLDNTYRFTFYDDDGETFDYENGNYHELEIEVVSTSEQLKIDIINIEGNYIPPYEKIDVHIIGRNNEQEVFINGVKCSDNPIISLVE